MLFFVGVAGCAHAPPADFAFALLGDTPYSAREVRRLDRLIDDLNGERLELVVHLGDLGAARDACTDAWLDARKDQLARIRHPVVLVPGDNEWTDCRDQAARLAAWRRRFCAAPFRVETQPGEYCEHRRWQAGGVMFVTLNVPGSGNNARDPAEQARRMRAVRAWLDESATLAARAGLPLAVLMHADPFARKGYAELRERLKRLGPAILVHGDGHLWIEDEPWPGVQRLELWGSPFVSWVRAEAGAGDVRFSAPRYR